MSDGDGVEVGPVKFCLVDRLMNDRENGFKMRTGGNFWDHSAVGLKNIDLRNNNITQNVSAVLNNSGSSFITRSFDPKDVHRGDYSIDWEKDGVNVMVSKYGMMKIMNEEKWENLKKRRKRGWLRVGILVVIMIVVMMLMAVIERNEKEKIDEGKEPLTGQREEQSEFDSEKLESERRRREEEEERKEVQTKESGEKMATEKNETEEQREWTKQQVKKGEAPYYIKISRSENVMMVYGRDEYGNYNRLVKTFIASTGKNDASPIGVYTVDKQFQWRWAEMFGGAQAQYVTRITGFYLMHSVPYYERREDALKWEEFNKLGEQASMGCVRLQLGDAKWIYDNVTTGTKVEIYDGALPAGVVKPVAPKLEVTEPRRGWDPTNPLPMNPWR